MKRPIAHIKVVLELPPRVGPSGRAACDPQHDEGLLETTVRCLDGWVAASGARSLRLEQPRQRQQPPDVRCASSVNAGISVDGPSWQENPL